MALRDVDWTHLRRGLLGPVLLLLGCTVVWGAMTVYDSRAAATLQAEQQALASLEA